MSDRNVNRATIMPVEATKAAAAQSETGAEAHAIASVRAPIDVIYLITELNIGGAEKVLVHLLSELDRSRYRPQVVCLYAGDGPIADELRTQNIPVTDLGMTAQWRVDAIWRLYRLLRRKRPAILHSSLFHANLLGRLVGRLARVPIIISCRQNVSIGARWREWVNRWTVGLDDRVIAVCELARQAEIERGHVPPPKVTTIYNAVDPARVSESEEDAAAPLDALTHAKASNQKIIGTICRFHPQKGLDQLVAAFAALRQSIPDVHLLLVGDGELRPTLEAQVHALGLADHVTFTGFRTDVPAILAQLDLFVLPSHWEGLPVVLLEAMTAQVPVIATAVGGTPELVVDGETGLLIPPGDPAALTAAMHFLLTQDALRQEMGRRGRQRVESKFSATRAAKQTTQLYDELLLEKGLKRPATHQVRVLHPITRMIIGGAQENTMLTAQLLDGNEWDAVVFCGPQTGPEGSLIETARDHGVSLVVDPTLVREIHPLKDMLALLRLCRFMRDGNFAIVHTHSSKAGILGRWAAKLAGVPVIVHTVHGWGHHDRQHPLVRGLYIWLEKRTLPITDRLIVVSARNIEKGLQDGIGTADDYVVIRSGIELDRFGHPQTPRADTRAALSIPEGVPVIGTVTRLSAQKAPLDFVRAAAEIAAADPSAHFVMVGDGPLRDAVEALAAELGIADRLVLTGLRRDVPELMAAFDIFVLSSLWEGLPRVLPQAMATGLPVVATAIDGNTEIVKDGINGLLTPPGAPDLLARAVLQLLEDPPLAAQMGRAGRAQVAEFGAERMVEQIAELYRQLLREKNLQ